MKKNQSFQEAFSAMGRGKTARRKSWPDNVFAFVRPEDTLPIGVLLGVKSLPKKVKDYYERKHQPIITPDDAEIKFTGYLCLKNEADEIVNGWHPGIEDLIVSDWEYDEF